MPKKPKQPKENKSKANKPVTGWDRLMLSKADNYVRYNDLMDKIKDSNSFIENLVTDLVDNTGPDDIDGEFSGDFDYEDPTSARNYEPMIQRIERSHEESNNMAIYFSELNEVFEKFKIISMKCALVEAVKGQFSRVHIILDDSEALVFVEDNHLHEMAVFEGVNDFWDKFIKLNP